MFTLAISSLTTSNLSIRGPNIPGSYAILFLQHCTLLPLTVTAKTGHCVHFGSAFLFFLELFLHSSPVAYWAHTDLGSSSFTVISFRLFILFMGFSRQYWRGLPFPSPVNYIRSELFTMTHLSWLALHIVAEFYRVRQGCGPCDQFDSFSVTVVFILSFSDW